ncbi:hypothetical protein PUN28_004636 [Cardiocondyla obscurior]|uniref:Uncharacterized protein n=1 Tax=Cardiocondyla obscurior TaxID=286306 RepID=A0AAW2GBV9_9HYME
MEKTRLVFAYFTVFLLFMVFKEATFEVDRALSKIKPIAVKNDIKPSKIKLDRFRRKSHLIYRDDDKTDNIRPQIKQEKIRREPKIWDHWGNWSTCSVTCGIGKIVRWRHCIGGYCSLGEKKAQMKTCTFAAC